MPTEITTGGVQKLSGILNTVSVTKQSNTHSANTEIRRQELPSAVQTASSSAAVEDGNTVDKTIEKKVENLNSRMQNLQRDLQFSVDADSGRTVIRVIDRATREIIRVIPPEDVSAMAQRMDKHSGVLFSTSV